MPRHTKIVATLGPASSDPGVLRKMFSAGVNVVRMNFSHGTAADHMARAQTVRETARELGITCHAATVLDFGARTGHDALRMLVQSLLGLPADARDYTAAARMLDDMGIRSVRLLSNNPEKKRQLEQFGIKINDLVPLVVGLGEFNTGYLNVKRDRMGHQLPGTLPAIDPAPKAKEVTA